jgi:hypothetical protein
LLFSVAYQRQNDYIRLQESACLCQTNFETIGSTITKGELMSTHRQDPYHKTLALLSHWTSINAAHGDIHPILAKANGYILEHLTDGFAAGCPQFISVVGKGLWIVPVILSPKSGATGEVGVIAIDSETQEIVGSTTISEMLAKAETMIQYATTEIL